MNIPSVSTRDLAQRLLAIEALSNSPISSQAHEAVRVCGKLQVSLTRFAGADGFSALLRRALALARIEVAAVQTVRLQPDGSLGGLEELLADSTNGGNPAAVAIVSRLLGLLVTFIGDRLTLQMLRDAWPDGALGEQYQRIEII